MSQPIDPSLSRRLVLAGLSATAASAAFPSIALAGDPDILPVACSEPAGSPTGAALKRWKKAAESEDRGDGRFKLKLKFKLKPKPKIKLRLKLRQKVKLPLRLKDGARAKATAEAAAPAQAKA